MEGIVPPQEGGDPSYVGSVAVLTVDFARGKRFW